MEGPRTAIITGASRGIGALLVEAFRERGYRIVANSRHITTSHPFNSLHDLLLIDGDIARRDTAEKLAVAAIDKFGSIDVLVNNAGIFSSRAFTEYTEDDFASFLGTHLGGFFHISQLAVKQMVSQQSGCIINISASLADQPLRTIPAALAIMTKGGLNAVTRGLAMEYMSDGIRVNAVSAGIIDTPMHDKSSHSLLRTLVPMGRLGKVDEIVHAVLYLVDATFVTGEVLHVDGGQHAGKW